MFRLVEHLCPRLDQDGLSVLYGHLRRLPPQYEEMHVELIRQFAEAANDWGTCNVIDGGGLGGRRECKYRERGDGGGWRNPELQGITS